MANKFVKLTDSYLIKKMNSGNYVLKNSNSKFTLKPKVSNQLFLYLNNEIGFSKPQIALLLKMIQVYNRNNLSGSRDFNEENLIDSISLKLNEMVQYEGNN